MKYEITYACGHTATVNLYGPTAERKKRLEWFQNNAVCPDCYKAAMDAENAEGCEEVTMTYAEYKNGYADCKTKRDSYNADTKTIVVYVPHSEVVEDAPAAEEATAASESADTAEDVADTVNNAVAAAINSGNPVYCKVISAGYTWRISFRVKDDGSASLAGATWNPAANGDSGVGLTLEENTVFRFYQESPPDTNNCQDFEEWSYRQWLEYEEDPHSGYVTVGTIDLSGLSIGEAVARLLAHTPDYLA